MSPLDLISAFLIACPIGTKPSVVGVSSSSPSCFARLNKNKKDKYLC